MKKFTHNFLAVLLILSMMVSFIPATSALQVSLPLYDGTILVADANTQYVTFFEQDPTTKMITATVSVHNNNPAGGAAIEISGIGVDIYFANTLAPYDPVYSTLYSGGMKTNDASNLITYGTPLITGWFFSAQVIQNDASHNMIGTKVTSDNDGSVIIPAGGASVPLAKFYFMPINRTDKLNLDMFKYQYRAMPKNSTWVGLNNKYLVSTSSFPQLIYDYAVYSDAFKMHVKHPAPVGLTADNDARVIDGYDAGTMEWANDENGPFSSGAPVIPDDASTIWVRMQGSDYGSTDGEYVNYKKYLPSNAVGVVFSDNFFPADAYATKTSENTSRTDGTTYVNDILRYTITVGNNADARSAWTDVVITDRIPDGVTFVAHSVKVDGVTRAYTYVAATKTLTIALGDVKGQEEYEVTFEATVDSNAYGQTVKNSANIKGEDGDSGEEIEKNPEEDEGRDIIDQSSQPDIDPITEGDRTVTGEGVPDAEIVVSFPDGSEETATVDNDGKWSVTVPPSVDLVEDDVVTVVQTETGKMPSEPKDETVLGRPDYVPTGTKTSRNLTVRADGTNRVGDTFEYTITAKNDGPAKSLWENVVITDELPEGVTFVAGSLKIDNVAATENYNAATHTLTVALGDLESGVQKVVTFQVTVNEKAYGADIQNVATISGKTDPVIDPDPKPVVDKSAAPTIDPITEGDRTVSGTGVNGATIEVTFPGGSTATAVVSGGTWTVNVPSSVDLVDGNVVTAVQTELDKETSDPVDETVVGRPAIGDNNAQVEKTSVNLTNRADGTTRVGDTLEYTVVVKNAGDPKSLWEGAVMTDTLPTGVTFVPGSVKIDGVAVTETYAGGTLTVLVGDLLGGTQKVVTFRATVNETAYGTTVINSVTVKGKDAGTGEDVEVTDTEDEGHDIADKSPKPVIDEVNEGDRIITGTGVADSKIVVSFPGSILTRETTVGTDGTWSVTVPGSINLLEGDTVEAVQTVSDLDPSDPAIAPVNAKKTVVPYLEKTSENVTTQDGFTHVGDKILYTITVRNDGSSKSLWTGVVVTDEIPAGVTYVSGSVLLNNIKPTYSSFVDGVLSVSCGDIAGGATKTITFEVTVDADAYGMTIKNGAAVNGKNNGGEDIGTETEEPGGHTVWDKSETPTIDDVTRDDTTVSGTGVPDAEIVVTFPDGDEVTTTVDEDGTWTVDVPDDVNLDNGDIITAVQTEPGKDPSDEAEAIVNDKNYRAITGLVFPFVSDDMGLGQEFLDGFEITVELRATYNTPADPSLITNPVFEEDGVGRFTINNVPFGEYVLVISRPGYLSRCMTIVVSPDDDDLTEVTPSDGAIHVLWWGDVDDNAFVDGSDSMIILGKQGIAYGDTKYWASCDFDATGLIDGSDMMLVLGNINISMFDYPDVGTVNFDI